jgi:hypothetical protein
MKSILYVSKAQLGAPDAGEEVDRIVAGAREKNRTNGISGMLVFTGDHFSQVLEGPEEPLDELMVSIRRDQRHHSLCEFARPVSARSFAAWSLGYEGQSTYVDRLVRSLFASEPEADLGEAQAELQELMLLLAHQRGSALLPSA